MKILFAFLTIALVSMNQIIAHGHPRSMHPRELARRQLEANGRHVVARNCAPQIAEYQQKRKLARRSQASKTTTSSAPHSTGITNDTCITAPEIIEGPYYLNDDLVRTDLRDRQVGIPFELDIGVIDTSTCKPLPNVLVELWHCNATGVYSGFTLVDSSVIPGTNTTDTAATATPTPAPTTSFSLASDWWKYFTEQIPSPPKTDNTNFLRGGWKTDKHGLVSFKTIYPGYYTARAVHVHVMIHQNTTFNHNGTFSSHSGSLVHAGQMFFDDTLNDKVLATSPYNTNTQVRTRNDDDLWLLQESANGYNAYIDATPIGHDIRDGIHGFITIGVDTTARYEISSPNFYATGPFEEVSSSPTDTRAHTSASTVARSGW